MTFIKTAMAGKIMEKAFAISGNGNKDTKGRLAHSNSEFKFIDEKIEDEFKAGPGCCYTMDDFNKRLITHAVDLENFEFDDVWNINDNFDNLERMINVSSRGSKVTDTSMTSNASVKDICQAFSSANKKPLLVELHTFPGYFDGGPTPLPANLEPVFILNIVTNAQHDLDYKSVYKETFVKFFESKQSCDLLQDIFWWFFCRKYQSNAAAELKMFTRISINYTCLMFAWIRNKYCNTLLKSYADLMAECVYSTFCHAFPSSYRQFNSSFRDELIDIISLWMLGTKPAPHAWKNWNFIDLEPSDLRKGEKIQEEAARGSKGFEIDFNQVEDLAKINRRASRRLSVMPLKINRRQSIVGGGNQLKTVLNKTTSKLVPESSSIVSHTPFHKDMKKINQGFIQKTVSEDLQHESSKTLHSESKVNRNNKEKIVKKEGTNKSPEKTVKNISSVMGLTDSNTENSCAVGQGPIFSKRAFNIFGRSPLVSYFLLKNNLLGDIGKSTFVKRTEISRLPSMLNETYKDVIKKVKSSSEKQRDLFNKASKEHEKKRYACAKKWLEFDKRYERGSKKLLSHSQNIKNISDLIRATDKNAEDTEIRLSKLRHIIEYAIDEQH